MKSDIFALFTSEDRDEIKQAMKECIIEQMKIELEEFRPAYMVDEEQLSEILSETLAEIKEEIKAEYKDMLRKQMEEKFKKL
jgi:hypothetical protein